MTRKTPVIVAAGLLAALAAGLAVPAPAASAPAGPQTLPATRPAALVATDVEGTARRPLAVPADSKGVVVFFLAHDCPISNSYAPEVNRICAAYGGPKGFSFALVHPYQKLEAAEARQHAKDYGYVAPVFVDGDRALTTALGARVTPQAVVVGPDGTVLYRGRIDDKWVGYGRGRVEPTARDLRNALDAIAAGKPAPPPTGEPVGCPIE
ncbi:MAG TPA: redoxin family protein [Humisphaera sp.]